MPVMNPEVKHYWTPRSQDKAVIREFSQALRNGCTEKVKRILSAVYMDGVAEAVRRRIKYLDAPSGQLYYKLVSIQNTYEEKGTLAAV